MILRISSQRKTLIAVIGSLFITGCGQNNHPIATAPPATAIKASATIQQIAIDNFSFSPATITVAAGTTITWTNHDDVPHTVTADDKQFNSGAMDTDDRFSRIFSTPGTYSYFCAVHTHMTGRIIVK
jgi:plastocyanin